MAVSGMMPEGESVGIGDGATVFVVCGCVPDGEELGNGVTVAVGIGADCKGVTVAVGRGPAGMVIWGEGDELGSLSFCA